MQIDADPGGNRGTVRQQRRGSVSASDDGRRDPDLSGRVAVHNSGSVGIPVLIPYQLQSRARADLDQRQRFAYVLVDVAEARVQIGAALDLVRLYDLGLQERNDTVSVFEAEILERRERLPDVSRLLDESVIVAAQLVIGAGEQQVLNRAEEQVRHRLARSCMRGDPEQFIVGGDAQRQMLVQIAGACAFLTRKACETVGQACVNQINPSFFHHFTTSG